VIANPRDTVIDGSVMVIPVKGDPVSKPVSIAPLSSLTLKLRDVVVSPQVAVLLDLRGGQAVAELALNAGTVSTPCASSASRSWYFADGSTAKDHTLTLALFNPFPEDAIADLSFTTDQGQAVPADFQGLVVPGRTLRMVDVGEHVRRREWVASEVQTRTGRLVVDQVQRRPLPGASGTTIRLGAPTPGESWWFPEGARIPGITDTFNIFNPGESEAVVELAPTLAETSAEPFELTVPARGRATVQTSTEDRIPEGGYAMIVRSLNGVPVVAERHQQRVPPDGYSGRADLLGSRRLSRRWLFATGALSPSVDEYLFLYNPGQTEASVDLRRFVGGHLVDGPKLIDRPVPAAGFIFVKLPTDENEIGVSVVVVSTEPVVVERGLYASGSPSFSTALGVPLE
jgi:hypothetical protein